MVGSDGDRRGGIPEGVVLQIRPSVDLRAIDLARSARVVATMLQDYGCAITDGGGPGAATIRVERARWGGTALRGGALFAIPWRAWRFAAAGHGRWCGRGRRCRKAAGPGPSGSGRGRCR